MAFKKAMKYQFDKIDKKKITITDLAKSLNCSRTWLSILVNS